MTYDIIPNAILFIAIIAVLVMFFRHVPEVIDANASAGKATTAEDAEEKKSTTWPQRFVIWFQASVSAIKKFFLFCTKKVWQFMLEAKDLKQGQILASKFARIVAPSSLRYTNTAVHKPMSEAEELFAAGKLDEAEQKFFSVIRKYPHEYTAYEGLVRIYIQEKEFDNLAETLEYLVKHVPGNDAYWAQYGNVMMSTRNYEKAVEAFKESVKLNNLIPARYANLGLSYQALGDKEAAGENIEKACELEPGNIQYLALWVEIMLQLGHREKVLQRLTKAREMFSGNEEMEKKIRELEKI